MIAANTDQYFGSGTMETTEAVMLGAEDDLRNPIEKSSSDNKTTYIQNVFDDLVSIR